MNFISANTLEMKDGVYDTILYLCDSPAFIWNADGPRVLKKNENAARFFLRYPCLENTSEIDINKAIPDWRNIPNKKNNSVWLKFVDNERSAKSNYFFC